MIKQNQGLNNNRNPHCLRSRKLNDEHLLLLKHFGEQTKNNKNTYKFIEESLNNFNNEDRIINKRFKYSPPPITKRAKSYSKKQNSSSKILRSKKKVNKSKEKNQSLEEKDLYNNKRRNNSNKNIYEENKSDIKYKKLKKNNDNKDNSSKNIIKKKNFKNKIKNIKNRKSINNNSRNNDNSNDASNNKINNNELNSNNKRERNENKKIEVRAIIIDDKIVDSKHAANQTQNNLNINNQNLNNNTNNIKNIGNINDNKNSMKPLEVFEKVNFKTALDNNNNNMKNLYEDRNKNFLLNSLLNKEREMKKLNNIEIKRKPFEILTYGKIINNKRVIFGVWQRQKNMTIPKVIRKRKRRRLKNILNYNKYIEKISNYIEIENGFRYLFNSNHKISKNYWHTKIDIISPVKKYIGNNSKKSGSEDNFQKLKIGKKRGRKKRRSDDLDDFEISLFSSLKNDLKKTDDDCEFLFNKSSIENSSKTKSIVKQNNNIKSTEISHKNNQNNNLDEKTNNNKHHNENDDNIEYLSITSTPEGKKRLRNNFSKSQYVFPYEVKRKYKKRKNKDINNDNESNFNDSQFSVKILNEQKNHYDYNDIDIDIDLSNSFNNNENDNDNENKNEEKKIENP